MNKRSLTSVEKQTGDPKYRGIYRYTASADGLTRLYLRYKKGDKWTYSIFGIERPHGNKIRSKAHNDAFFTIDDALASLNAIRANSLGVELSNNQKARLKAINESKRPRLTLDALAERYFKERPSAYAIKSKGYYATHIQPILGAKDANAITRADLVAFHETKIQTKKRAGGEYLSPKFVKNLLDLISAIYNAELGQEKPLVDRNPMAGLYKAHPNISKTDNEKDRTFTIDEVKAILCEAEADPIAYRFCLLAICTGARSGAIKTLKRKDIDLFNRTIRLIDEKARSAQVSKDAVYTIPLASYAVAALKDYLKRLKPNDYVVWADFDGCLTRDPRSDSGIRKRVQPIINRAVEGNANAMRKARLVVHSFRSFAVSSLINVGANETLARVFTNHSQPKRGSFHRYVRTEIEALRPHVEAAFKPVFDAPKYALANPDKITSQASVSQPSAIEKRINDGFGSLEDIGAFMASQKKYK
jgi:integrase